MRLLLQEVPHAWHRFDVFRVLGVVLDLLAQAVYVHLYKVLIPSP